MLHEVLQGLHLAGPAQDLFGRFPTLHEASLRLSWLMTQKLLYPLTGRPLLAHCMEDALFAGVNAKGSGRNVRKVFLTTLLRNACKLLEVDVRSRRERWDPLFDDGLATWFPDRSTMHVHPHPPRDIPLQSPERFYRGLALRIVSPSDLADLPLQLGSTECAA